MGLGEFFKKLSGGNPAKEGDAFMYMFGRDQHFCRRKVEAGGSHFQDNVRLLAYYSSHGCIGEQVRKVHNRTRPLGPVSIGYELITGLWDFPMLNWHEKMAVEAGKSESDMVLDNGFAEGFAMAEQKESRQAWMQQLTTVLFLAVLGFFLIVLLIGMQTGVIGNFLAAIPKFIHGG
jgi:hypothetical protein